MLRERGLQRCCAPKTAVWLDMLAQVIEHLDGNFPTSSDEEEDAGDHPAEGFAPALPAIHPSHRPLSRGQWTWCRRCGCHTRGVRILHLAQRCLGPTTKQGRRSLKRERDGLPPLQGTTVWGDEVNLEHSPQGPHAGVTDDGRLSAHCVEWAGGGEQPSLQSSGVSAPVCSEAPFAFASV